MKRFPIVALIALLLSMCLFGTALAHASLVSSTPKDGATLDAVPEIITLVFDDELNEQSGFTLVDASGATVSEGKLDLNDLDRKTLSGTMPSDAASGTYTVNWVAVSADDNNREEGNISFTLNIQAPTAAATEEPTVAPTTAPTAAPTTAPTEAVAPTEAPRPTIVVVNSPTSPDGPTPVDDGGATVGRQIALVVGLITVVGIVAAVVLTRRRRS